MGLKHLSDDEIQSYLDGTSSEYNEPVAQHLAECEQCRQELQVYRALYGSLSDAPVESLAPGFSDRLLARLPNAPVRANGWQLSERLVAIFAIAAVALVGAIFFDWSQLLSFALGSFSALGDTVAQASSRHLDLRLLGAAAMILLLIPLADRAISQLFRKGANSH
jgi:anti-sigma factor RsiW